MLRGDPRRRRKKVETSELQGSYSPRSLLGLSPGGDPLGTQMTITYRRNNRHHWGPRTPLEICRIIAHVPELGCDYIKIATADAFPRLV